MPKQLLAAWAISKELFPVFGGRGCYKELGVFVEDQDNSAGAIYRKEDVVKFFERYPKKDIKDFATEEYLPRMYTTLFENHLGTEKENRIIVISEKWEADDPQALRVSSFRAYHAFYDPMRVDPREFEPTQKRRSESGSSSLERALR